MSIATVEGYTPERWIYALKDKLWGHVIERSEECFERAAEEREKVKTIEELEKYAEEKRKFFIDSLGGIPYDNTLPLNARVTSVIEEPGLRIENIIFESRPNVYVTGNLYIPEKRKKPCGAVLFQKGHDAEGKVEAGGQKNARAIASCGLVVFMFDPLGQGERLGYYEPSLRKPLIAPTVWEHQYAGDQCLLTGDNIARYFIADAMRAVDYLVSRPEVDPERIGATGASGGGTATCHMMVCDPRIKAAAPCVFVTTRQNYLYAGGAQDSEQIWFGATQNGFDHHELLMCFAPKPLKLLTVDSDFFPIEGTEKVVNATKRFWEMHGAGEKLSMITDKSQHNYTTMLALSAAEFFAKELNGEHITPDENALRSVPKEKLWCTKDGQVKLEFPDCKFVYDENLERFKAAPKPEKSLKEFLLEKIEYSRTPVPLRLRTYDPMYDNDLKIIPYMWFAQEKMPNWGLLFSQFDKTPTEAVVCLWDKGTDSIEEHINTIRKICKEGKAAFVVDLSAMGKCAPHSLNPGWGYKSIYGVLDKLTKDLFFLGDSLCALRMFELKYVADEVLSKLGLKFSIYAEQTCTVYAKFFKEISPDTEISLHEECSTYNEIVESKYYEDYNIAGILMPGIAKYCKE